MKNLSEFVGEKLLVHQPSMWKSYYELKYGDEVIATMHAKGLFGINMIVVMGKDEWEFYHPSIWKADIGIRQKGYELPYATYKREGLKQRGRVKFYRGGEVIIDQKLLKRDFHIYSLKGEKLVTFTERAAFKEKIEVMINQRDEIIEKYPWVVILAWFIALRRKKAAHAG